MSARTLLVATCLTSLLAAATAQAEISDRPGGGKSSGGTTITRPGPVQAQCWQDGNRIIDERNLRGPNLGAVLRDNALLFKGAKGGGAEIVIVAVGRATCLVRPDG